jgi:hypothetical protein
MDLLSIICKDPSISNTAPNQWGICYEEIVISSNKETAEFESEFENVQISTTGAEKKVIRDIHMNMLIDLFRSKNTTKIRPIITFNKLFFTNSY